MSRGTAGGWNTPPACAPSGARDMEQPATFLRGQKETRVGRKGQSVAGYTGSPEFNPRHWGVHRAPRGPKHCWGNLHH